MLVAIVHDSCQTGFLQGQGKFVDKDSVSAVFVCEL